MTINMTKEGEKLTVAVAGNLGTSTAVELDETVTKEIANVKELVFDLGKLDYMSSAGLRVFMSAAKTIKKQQGAMKLINVPAPVMNVFAITGVSEVLDITAL